MVSTTGALVLSLGIDGPRDDDQRVASSRFEPLRGYPSTTADECPFRWLN